MVTGRIAEHAGYRATVEQFYAAAREAWTDALPALRSAREKHEEKYPERNRATPRTEPDGSWGADEGRGLNPERHVETTSACAEIRAEGSEVVLPVTAREALAKVPDAVRFTLTYSAERYSDGVRADVDRFKAEGFELIKLKNLWSGDQYKGINSQWRRPETGLRFEMQFHTLESLEAKELTHKAYERIRSSASAVERRELEAFQSQVNALIVTPPGAAGIEDFPEKNNG